MEKPAPNSNYEQQSPTTQTRRNFLAGASYAAITAATMTGTATGLSGAAAAAESGAGGNAPSGGPITKVTRKGKILKFDPKPLVTPMFTSTLIQLGPEGVTEGTGRPDDVCPQIALASVQPGTKFAPLMHDGLGLLVLIPSLKFTPGSRRSDVEIRFDGARPTRTDHSGVAGPQGAREFVVYPYAYASVPFFTHPEEPLEKSIFDSLPDRGAAWRSLPTPTAWHNPPPVTRNPLDRIKHARKANGFVAYLCQLGSKDWSAEYDYYDSTPYVMLVDFEPNAMIPAALHNGWSAVGVIDGSIDVSGIPSTEGALTLFEPLAKQVFKAGPNGSTVMMFFDSGRAAFPVWENPTSATVMAINNALRIPS
jgi:hypothetical protein